MNRIFPVTKIEIPLDKPADTVFSLGISEKITMTGSNNKTTSQLLQKIENLPKAHSLLKEAQITATSIMNTATTGYVTIIKNEDGSEALYISNTKDYRDATQLWKWSLSGLGYWTNAKEPNAANRTKTFGELTNPFFGMAMTMDGAIVADFITAGTMSADRVRTGILQSENQHVVFDLTNGKLTMKSGSIHIGTTEAGETAFEVDERGNLTARRGTFQGHVVATSGSFYGSVQATEFLLSNGKSLVSLIDEAGKIKGEWLNLMGLTITNKAGDAVMTISEDGIKFGSQYKPIKVRYSTNQNASIPSGFSETWKSSWTGTTTEVWAIYSYDGGITWTQTPSLIQGKTGARGPAGSDANVPAWVEAYTRTATYIDSQWVIAPNIAGGTITALDRMEASCDFYVGDKIQLGDPSSHGKSIIFSSSASISNPLNSEGLTLSAFGDIELITSSNLDLSRVGDIIWGHNAPVAVFG